LHAADALRARTQRPPEWAAFCFNERVAKDYQIDETEEELRLHVPPPNVVWKVTISTIVASSSLWFGGVSFYLWLARSESKWAFLYCIAYNLLALLCLAALRVLYRQLAAKEVSFERHVIGIDDRILGIRVRQRWFRADSVEQWITMPNRNGRDLLIAMRYRDKTIKLVETLDPDLWLSLIVQMQRKDFTYV
jgi:hypothetical protein